MFFCHSKSHEHVRQHAPNPKSKTPRQISVISKGLFFSIRMEIIHLSYHVFFQVYKEKKNLTHSLLVRCLVRSSWHHLRKYRLASCMSMTNNVGKLIQDFQPGFTSMTEESKSCVESIFLYNQQMLYISSCCLVRFRSVL